MDEAGAAALGGKQLSASSVKVGGPEAGVFKHQPCVVHGELAAKCAICGLVEITIAVDAGVGLLEHFQRQLGKSEPCGAHARAAADRQCEPSNGQEVRERAEGEIDIVTSGSLGDRHASETPSARRVTAHVYGNRHVLDEAGDLAVSRLPVPVARRDVTQTGLRRIAL